MKNSLTFLAVLCTFWCISISSHAQHLEFDWFKRTEGIKGQFHFGRSTAYAFTKDLFGNVYMTGTFRNKVDFDPGPGVYELDAEESKNIFVTKYDAHGSFIWAVQFKVDRNGWASTYSSHVEVGPLGNVYVAGVFTHEIEFGSGSNKITREAYGNEDTFLTKLDKSGNPVWVKHIGGKGDDEPEGLKIDQWGTVYFTGNFSFDCYFDLGNSTLKRSGKDGRMFIAKISPSGNYEYLHQLKGYSIALEVDNSGDLYIAGGSAGKVDFDPGPDTNYIGDSITRFVAVAKFDPLGNLIWAKSLNGTKWVDNQSYDMTIDSDRNVYVNGFFKTTIDFDPGIDVFKLTAKGDKDVFVCKLNENGDFSWARQFHSDKFINCFSLDVDDAQNVYLPMVFNGTVDFDPLGSTKEITVDWGGRAILTLDKNGEYSDVRHFKSEDGIIMIEDVHVDELNNVFFTGNVSGKVDLGSGVSSTPSKTNVAFILKYKPKGVGVEELSEKKDLTVYPNPVTDQLTINTPETIEEIMVIDARGVVVQRENITSFSVAGLPTGIYNLLVRTQKETKYSKLIKQ